MRPLVLDADGVRLDTDRPNPAPAIGEVLVRVLQAGICERDVELIQGYKGFRGVLGHEFVGIALGSDSGGQRVVGGSIAVAGRARPAQPVILHEPS